MLRLHLNPHSMLVEEREPKVYMLTYLTIGHPVGEVNGHKADISIFKVLEHGFCNFVAWECC